MRKLLMIIGICFGLFACEEEKLPEVTNPRLSVAYIQEIDSTGVVFAANIIDIGKQEIIEHGFYYGSSVINILQAGDKIKKDGAPESLFELKATHSLEKGKQYSVVAFIKTAEGITHSLPTTFVSEGSPSFIFDRIEYNDKIYFNDTIRVYGENLSPKLGTYKAKINGIEARISALTDEYFEFIIPDNLDIQFGTTSRFDFEISGKNLTLQLPFQLREPEFFEYENRFLDFSTPFVIKGKYLKTNGIYIELIGDQFYYVNENITVTDSTISFKPLAIFYSNEPRFNVKIRGQNYLVENNFKIKPTLLEPNQVLNINSIKRKKVTLKGSNFNPFDPYLNTIKIDDNSISYEAVSVTENELEVLFYMNGINHNKTFNVSIVSTGIESSNKVQVNIFDPRTEIMDLDFGSIRVFRSIGNKIYFISSNKVFEIDIASKTNIQKASIPDLFNGHDYGDMIIENQGNLYFNLSNYSNNVSDNKFFVYNTATNSITELPKIPSESLRLLSYFAIDNEIYVLASSIEFENNNMVYKNHILKYNISNQNWIRINDINNPKSFIVIPFEYHGETYGIAGNYQNPNGTELAKFNPTTNQWVIVTTFPQMTTFDRFNQGSVIGDNVYFGDINGGYSIDMKNLTLEKIDTENIYFNLGTSIGDYYYFPYSHDFGNSGSLIRFDPSL